MNSNKWPWPKPPQGDEELEEELDDGGMWEMRNV